MAVEFLVHRFDDSEAQAFFDYAGYHARDMREPFRRTGSLLRAAIIESFLYESEFGTRVKWKPLKPAYAREKFAEVGEKPILVRRGTLRYYATSGSAFRYTRNSMTYRLKGRTGIVGAFHMQGREDSLSIDKFGTINIDERGNAVMNGGMPAREWFGWGVEQNEEMKLIFTQWLNELRASNRRRSGAARNPGGSMRMPRAVDPFDLLDMDF